MCSYSWINGTAACQNPYTLSTVLRQQFGFTGFVTSDWGATHSTAASANAGLDMDMPGNDGYYGSALQSAVTSGPPGAGQVSQATINSAVSDILTEMFAFGHVRQGTERVAVGRGDELDRPGGRDPAGRGGDGAAEELRQRPAAHLV